jgi:nicotinamidase-related amidase
MTPPFYGLCLAAGILAMSIPTPMKSPDAVLKLNLRTRVETFKGSGQWDETLIKKELPASETAIIICDMWDQHWCASATRRCGDIAKKMAPVVDAARKKGVFIIHAPSECMDAYKDTPQRHRMQEVSQAQPPAALTITEAPLPIDDSDGGCDDQPQCRTYKAWSKQHPALTIAPEDGVSDKGAEVYTVLKQRGIKNLLVMGVHTNMCVLGRSFAIRQMTRWGMRCILVRDLTDTMYNPRMRPFVPHEQGTDLVVQHIEKYWCPTVLGSDLLR